MRVRVRLFSLFREKAGTTQLELDLPSGAALRDAVARLRTEAPALGPLLDQPELVLTSVNLEYAGPETLLREGDEVGIFPPVSGGSGGLAKGLLLLSGGFDSPVAGHWAASQGHALEAVHFSMEPFTDDASSRKAARLAALLGLSKVTIVRLGPQLAELAKRCEPRCYFVLQKRLMLRVAGRLARSCAASFLLTGENLGQVSSQTLENLAAIDAAAPLPVVRPLLGLDKRDIIDQAKEIGTYEVSKGPEVCDVLGPKHPSTKVTLARVESEESKVDVAALVEAALADAFDAEPIREPAEAAWTVVRCGAGRATVTSR